MSVGRIIVEKPIAEEFASKLAAKAASLPSGDPTIPETVIGPLINEDQVKKVDGYVQDAVAAGAKLLAGGKYEGRVYEATVLSDVSRDMRAWQEEIFGPVAPVLAVADEKEALEAANDTTYGLSSGVITPDLEKAIYLAEGLEAGMVHVNDCSVDAEASVPFGGSKWSGQGREGGRYSVDMLTEMKWVTIHKEKRQYPF
jgi:aldehyde dehydrogenase (NAD+)